MKKIAVFTSGGDAPGMNACIRAVVRTALYYEMQVMGIMRGYEGMIEGDFVVLEASSVGNIIQRGGTILQTARSKEFRTPEGRKEAYQNLVKFGIEGVVAIGGDGTFSGAREFMSEYPQIPFIGIPGTIDNDLYGTDYTLGFDTAINIAVEAIDRIRDTADSHNRLFFVEVMGRDAGFIALNAGIAGGAEAILMPETPTHLDELVKSLEDGKRRKKKSSIVIVSEGEEEGGAFKIAEKVKQQIDFFDIRVVVLGHIQRGGAPSCKDRVLAARMGMAAVEGLRSGAKKVMVGVRHHDIVFTQMEKAVKHHQDINVEMLKMMNILAR
jgi:6-phosphofructokinase 1